MAGTFKGAVSLRSSSHSLVTVEIVRPSGEVSDHTRPAPKGRQVGHQILNTPLFHVASSLFS